MLRTLVILGIVLIHANLLLAQESGGSAFGRVQMKAASPPIGSLTVLAIGSWSRATAPVLSDGSFRLTGLQAGRYTFITVASGLCQTNEVFDEVKPRALLDLSNKPLMLSTDLNECFSSDKAYLPTAQASFGAAPFGTIPKESATLRLHAIDAKGQPLAGPSRVEITNLAMNKKTELEGEDVSAVLDIIGVPPGKFSVKVYPFLSNSGSEPAEVTAVANKVTYIQVSFAKVEKRPSGKKPTRGAVKK